MSFCTKCMKMSTFRVDAKCTDMCVIDGLDEEHDGLGYVPTDLNIGGGDMIHMEICRICGHIQGEWPLKFESGEK